MPRACNRLHLSPSAATSQRIPARHSGGGERLVFLYHKAMTFSGRLLVTVAHLEFFQLVLRVDFQRRIHGLILSHEVLEPERKRCTVVWIWTHQKPH